MVQQVNNLDTPKMFSKSWAFGPPKIRSRSSESEQLKKLEVRVDREEGVYSEFKRPRSRSWRLGFLGLSHSDDVIGMKDLKGLMWKYTKG